MRFDRVPSSMHTSEIVQCRYLAQAVVSHPPAVAASCRPPATWDHLEVSFASSMGPPFRQ